MSKSTRKYRRPFRLELLESRYLMAGDTYLVNFQNDEATLPTRYLRDIGATFGNRGNGFSYGWSTDHMDQARERSADPDQRLDTLIHFEAGQNWEFALQNGLYEVTVAVGDPGNNDGVHTINVEGVNYWNAAPDVSTALVKSMQVSVSDGRLTIDAGVSANMATRINYVHIVGLSTGGNAAPAVPNITEPAVDGQTTNPADVHMEAVGYSDPDGNSHKSTDWEIWTIGTGAHPVWQTLGIEGVERLHTHLGDGVFINSRAGETTLAPNTNYQLLVRFRDDAGSVSNYAVRTFHTGSDSTTFPMELQDVANSSTPTWNYVSGGAVDLPFGGGLLTPGDSILAIDLDGGSQSPGNEQVTNAIDRTLAKYLNFGETNSGLIVTPSVGATLVTGFQITTANDAEERDPSSWALYGTNDTVISGNHSNGSLENWTLIQTGAIVLPSARNSLGPAVSVNNSTAYTSYRVIFTGVKNAAAANSMQIAEIQLFGDKVAGTPLLSPADNIRAIDLDGDSSYPGDEAPRNAVDGTLAKYLNFGKVNSGFIVTPAAGPSTVTSFQITTANDAAARDPSGWALYGTNEAIISADNSTGAAETWTLIDAGTLSLPAARSTLASRVTVSNSTAWTSYRVVFTGVKNEGSANSMQIGEIQFFGDNNVQPSPPSLRLEDGSTGALFVEINGREEAGNEVIHAPALANHAPLRVVILAGGQSLSLDRSDLTIVDGSGRNLTIYLPQISLAAGQRLDLWVSSAGSTYFGSSAQTMPNFSTLARSANLTIPFIATQAGFVVEQVGSGYRLPVNIAFVPNPGPNSNDPLYYVTELYGSIQVVTRDGTKHEFASGLLDYNPQGPISGSGEQGLTGIAVQRDEVNPEIYHLYVGMLWDNGAPPGGASHYPKVERIDSVAGGLSMASRTLLLNMQPETQGQSHQISNISIGPDGKLYVHNGDGFDASTAQNLDLFRGKILRMNLDGTPATDNPFYDASNGITARDYVYAYGLRNPFGGAWRASDGRHYQVENGPSVDRMSQVNPGVNYGWNGSNASMFVNAIYNWNPSHAPVNIAFVQQETFGGSQFPASMLDHAFVSESGPTYATGPQSQGKRLVEFTMDPSGNVVGGPTTLVEYVGEGKSTVVGLAAGPDGLYFTELYEDSGTGGPTGVGARIYRVRYINPLPGDYDIDGDVDDHDYLVWRNSFDSNLLLAADGNGNGIVDSADYTIWRDRIGTSLPAAGSGSQSSTAFTVEESLEPAPRDAISRALAPAPERFDAALASLIMSVDTHLDAAGSRSSKAALGVFIQAPSPHHDLRHDVALLAVRRSLECSSSEEPRMRIANDIALERADGCKCEVIEGLSAILARRQLKH